MILCWGMAAPVLAQTTTTTATDDFSSLDYTGGSGWSGNWIDEEVGATSHTNGNIRSVSNGTLRLYRAITDDGGLYRDVAVTQTVVSDANLSFSYRGKSGNDAGQDLLIAEFSSDGGASYSELASLFSTSTSLTSTGAINLPGVDGAGTYRIRFRMLSGTQSGEDYYIDNVVFTVAGSMAPPAPVDYGDYSGFPTASQIADVGMRIGTSNTDGEASSPANSTATGDDNVGDDEDLIMPAFTVGSVTSLTIPVTLSGGTFQESGGQVVMEAENYQGLNQNSDPAGLDWTTSSAVSGAVGGQYLTTPLATNSIATWDNGCEASYNINFTTTGTYNVFVRRRYENGSDNSFFTGLNGTATANNDNGGVQSTWDWVNMGTVSVTSTGQQTFQVRRREEGYKLDRIVLSKSATVPTGNGPAESPTGSGSARINVFVDWNGDGDVADASETQSVQSVTSTGTRTFNLTPPIGTIPGTKYLRIRYSEGSTAPSFSGASALKGEVEDYAITVNPAPMLDYGDYSGFASASQTANSAIRIGSAATDFEANTWANSTATGDDNDSTNDEDLIMPTFNIGVATSVSVPVTVTTASLSSSAARINVFVDWNGDGDVADANETQTVQSVTGSGTRTFSLTPPVGTVPGTKFLRIRITEGTTAPAFSGASPLKGEVEDYAVTVNEPVTLDFGDLADTSAGTGSGNYQTLLANNGPSHVVIPGLRLGATIDAEANGAPSTNADGDGADEDGVSTLPTLTSGLLATLNAQVTNSTASAAKLSVWLDLNNNGNFEEDGEKVVNDFNVPAGTVNGTAAMSFVVPPTAVPGVPVGMRLRFSSDIALTSLGQASNGEVEDYRVTIQPSVTDYGDVPFGIASSVAWDAVRLGVVSTDGESSTNGAEAATSDDTGGRDDEDGITFTTPYAGNAVYAGGLMTITARVTNLSGAPAYLNLWIDWNMSGSPIDAGEKVIDNVLIADGTDGVDRTFTITVPQVAGMVSFARRVRARMTTVNNVSLTASGAGGGFGEVEDYSLYVTVPTLDYGDYLFGPTSSASQTAHSAIRIGTNATDADPVDPADGYANQDDLSGTNDEDLSMPSFTVGTTTTLSVPVTITAGSLSGSTSRLRVFVDWNGDGDVLDTNETLAAQSVTSSSTRSFSLTPPAGTAAGVKYLRIRFTEGSTAPTFSGASTLKGEVEDYAVTVNVSATANDFGDWNGSGAATSSTFSTVNSNLLLGATVDGEVARTGDANATADGADEDGVTLPAMLVQGQTGMTVAITRKNLAGSTAFLGGWIDFNRDGDFADAGEQIISNQGVPGGTNDTATYSFNVPSTAVIGLAGARFRISSSGNPGPTGSAGSGEIEDYVVNIVEQPGCFRVIVTNFDNNKLIGFKAEDGASLGTLASGGNLRYPSEMLLHDDGNLLVAMWDPNYDRISKYDPYSGAWLSTFSSPGGTVGTDRSNQIVHGPDGYLYVPRRNTHKVIRLNAATGAVVDTFLTSSNGLSTPRGLAFDNAGNLYVASSGNRQLRKYSSSGAFVGTVVTYASGVDIRAVARGPDGYLYTLTNTGAGTPASVQRVNPATGAATAWTTMTSGSGPMAWGPDGNLYVADYDGDKVRVFSSNGTAVRSLSQNLVGPCGIVLAPCSLMDFGDLPAPYPTDLSVDGARHVFVAGALRLGATSDADGDGHPSALADGDDTDTDGDDEDGIVFPVLPANTIANITVISSGTGKLNAFFDWNGDGDFLDAGEAQAELPVISGSNVLTVQIPASAPVGSSIGTRFRLSSLGGLSSTGAATDGEVEDYLVTIAPAPTIDFGDYSGFASASQTANSAIRIGTLATDAEVSSPANSTATGDDDMGDDEDLSMPAFTVGSATSLTVPVTIASPVTSARLRLFVDWNGDGDVTDTNETLAVQSVTSSGNKTFSLTPPIGTTPGTKYLRIRFAEGSSTPSFSGASALKGEVEDYAITVTVPTLTIGDLVWRDTDNDGFRDAGEPGIAGVTVQLFRTTDDYIGNGDDVQVGADITTAGSGAYSFGSLVPGKYFVKIPTVPAGYTMSSGVPDGFGTPSAFAENNQDNDNNGIHTQGIGTAVTSGLVDLAVGTESTADGDTDNNTNLTIDFGFAPAPECPPYLSWPDWRTLTRTAPTAGTGWISQPRAINSSYTSQTFSDVLSTGANVTVSYSANMWDIKSPNIYVPRFDPTYDNVNTQPNPDDVQCNPMFFGALRFTNNTGDTSTSVTSGVGTASGHAQMQITFDRDVFMDDLGLGSIGKIGGSREWVFVRAYDAAGVGVASASIVGQTVSCDDVVTGTGPQIINNGASGAYLGGLDDQQAATPVYGNASISWGSSPIRRIEIQLWRSSGTSTYNSAPTSGQASAAIRKLCFRAAPITDHGDYSGFPVAGQTADAGIRMGFAATDHESSSLANGSATGDDGDGSDDEDLVMPVVSPGVATNLIIPVTLGGSVTSARINVFADWNGDGDVNDSGETQSVQNVVSSGSRSFVLTPPSGTTIGTKYLRIRMVEGSTAPTFGGLSALRGEVEDYAVEVSQSYDFGDWDGSGAATATTSSVMNSSIRLGASVDAEVVATANAAATGDDTTGVDDEDGVTLPANAARGSSQSMTVNVTNTSGAPAYLNVWIDFDGNGSFSNSGERFASNVVIADGTSSANQTVNFTVPNDAMLGEVGVRVRLTSTSNPGPTGFSGSGEVEDHLLTVVCPVIALTPTALPVATAGSSYAGNSLSASGGISPYTYAVTSGTLPDGISLNGSNGNLSGAPTGSNGAGTSVTITATDKNGCSGSQVYSMQVCPVITLGPVTLINGMVNSAYTQTVGAVGGAAPYLYSLSTGALPAGLSLDTNTGIISGRPTSTSSANFTITVTDANGCAVSESYTVQPAAPTDYGDYASFGSASSAVLSTLKIGTLTDAEATSVNDGTATGDDLTDLADEDGVTLPAYLTRGFASSLSVNVTNLSGSSAYLNVWIDFNGNGSLADSGEQVATNTLIATGSNQVNQVVNFTVPAGAKLGMAGVRVRLTSVTNPGSTGAAGNGEVEDWLTNIILPADFGDFSKFGSANSAASSTLRMGAQVDSEITATLNTTATGDDTTGVDDEDGVTLPASVAQGQTGANVTVQVTNTTGAGAFVNGWVDFNNNGVLTDPGEQVVINDPVATGTNNANRVYSINIPTTAVTGAVGVRFRLTSIEEPGSTGLAGTGEVEDHRLTIVGTSDYGDFSRFASASSLITESIKLGALVDAEFTSNSNLAATGDDITNVNDEDGTTVQAIMVQGQAGVAVTVNVTNLSGAPAYLNGWVDFNNNGSLTDAGEQIVGNVVVADGTIGDYQTFFFDVPSSAPVGTVGIRFRFTSVSAPGPVGSAGSGEVEDYTATIVVPSSNFRDYFYAIRNVNGHFYLDEISVYNPNSSTPTVSVTPGILDMNVATPGFSSSASNAIMNGLALDWLNRRFYWAATSSGSSGYNFKLHSANYDNVSKTWNYQQVTGSTLTNIPFNTGFPNSSSAGAGAFPRAAFYEGEYYAGGQNNDNVAVWHLNATGLGLMTPNITDYPNFFHRTQTFGGGDFVIRPQDGLLVTSTAVNNNDNTIFVQSIADGINPSGPAATTVSIDSQIPVSVHSAVQIAGVGGVTRLYGLGANGTTLYRIDNYDTSSPHAVRVGPLPTASYTDLSEGISSSVTSLGVKGIVYDDSNGLMDNTVNGIGTNAGGTLFALLVHSNGKLVDAFPVKSDGTFILGGALANNSYTVVLSTTYGSLGSTAPPPNLPQGWVNIGEFLGIGAGSDGLVNGVLPVSIGNSGIVNAKLGIVQGCSLGNQVWDDANDNGLRDASESGIVGATVQLWTPGSDNAIGGTGSAADTLVNTTTTDGTGSYNFTNLLEGKYFVQVTPPAPYSLSSSVAAGDNGVDNDNNGSQPGGRGTTVFSPVVTLTRGLEPGNTASGGSNVENTVDFGLRMATDFGDYSGFAPATQIADSSIRIGTLDTDPEAINPANATATGDDDAGDDEDLTMPTFAVGTTTALSVPVTITAANLSGSTSRIRVFVDWNGDGDVSDLNETLSVQSVTSSGTKTFSLSPPVGTEAGTKYLRIRFSEGNTAPAFSGASTLKGEVEDYAITVSASVGIGNLVWNDANGDGFKDAGETGVSGLRVDLWGVGPNGSKQNGLGDDVYIGSTTTSATGGYLFSGLLAGNYYVRIPTPPAGMTLSSGIPDPADNNQDNDNNGLQPGGFGTAVTSPVISLVAGAEPGAAVDGDDSTSDATVDFGFTSTPICSTDGIYYANRDSGQLYSTNLATGATTQIGWLTPTNTFVNNESYRGDVAVFSDGRMFTIGFDSAQTTGRLFSVDRSTATATLIATHPGYIFAGLEAGSDGFLYAVSANSAQRGIYRIDPVSGVITTLFNTPFSYVGDIAQQGGNIFYATAWGNVAPITDGSSGHLIRIDMAAQTATDLGAIASDGGSIPGMDFDATGRLLAWSTSSKVYHITNYATSGAGTLLWSNVPSNIWGAAFFDGNCQIDDFGDYSGFPVATQRASSAIFMGSAQTDVETSNPANITATGDDLLGDDEDLTLPVFTIGTASTVSIPVSLTSSSLSGGTARLNVFVDWNGDGDVADSGETQTVQTVTTSGTRTFSVTPPNGTVAGTKFLRIRITEGTSAPAFSGNSALLGEVEDYAITVNCPAITVNPASLAEGMVGIAYSAPLSATPASSYRWSIAAGTLPTGLTLNPTSGILNGTPSSAGNFNFTVRASMGAVAMPELEFTTYNLDLNPGDTFNIRDYVVVKGAPSTPIDWSQIRFTYTEAGANDPVVPTDWNLSSFNSGTSVTVTAADAAAPGNSGAGRFRIYLVRNGQVEYDDHAEIRIEAGTSSKVNSAKANPVPQAIIPCSGSRNYTLRISPPLDYGDYSGFASASSQISNKLRLGGVADAEMSATTNALASGDDNTGTDDEDALSFPPVTAGQPVVLPVTVTNTTGAVAYINAWIDFNNDGMLSDVDERVATNVSVASGTTNGVISLNFEIPPDAVTAATSLGTRFRLTDIPNPGATGLSGIGEVEDHPVIILAPLTDFGDYSGAPTVSNTASTTLRLGALVDTEYAGTLSALATGDDVTGVDDEDGVTLPAMIAGAPATITTIVTNTTGLPAYLNAWADFDNNGVFTNSGEQIASNVVIAAGTSSATKLIEMTVPATAVTGTNVGVRVRLSSDISPGSTGAGGLGEVEDYVVNIAAPTTDFGDFSGFGNASSTQVDTIKLGALTDTEFAPTINASATGDDIKGSDDEDAVTLPTMTAGAPATIPVVVSNTSGADVFLNAWIDYNNNGVLTDPGEQIAVDVAIPTGTVDAVQELNITVEPSALTSVSVGVRFRLTSTFTAAPTGQSGEGEVEDYVVTILAPTTDFGDFSGFADASQGVNPSLRMGTLLDAEYVSTRNATATGDDNTASDDEDGVVIPPMIAGQTVTIPVTITNVTGATGFLNVWIDYNNNGILTDSGEHVAANLVIATGAVDAVTNLTVAVPANAVTGQNVGARFRLSAPSGLGPVGANGLAGELEDYVIVIAAPTTDFGDFASFGAASSVVDPDLRMGALVDTEYAGTVNAAATGDDSQGEDDEDGVTMPTALNMGTSVTIPLSLTNHTGADAYLHAWIDYNNDGVLNDSLVSAGGERLEPARLIPGNSRGTILREWWLGISGSIISNLTSNPAYPDSPTGVDHRTSFESPTDWADNLGQRMRGWVYPPVSGDYTFWVAGDDETQLFLSTDESPANAVMIANVPTWSSPRLWTKFFSQKSVTITLEADRPYYIEALMKEGGGLDNLAVAWEQVGSGTGPVVIAGEYLAPWNPSGPPSDVHEITFDVPMSASPGNGRGVRFRLTDEIDTLPVGESGNGEVEDYVVNLLSPTTDFGDFSGVAIASNAASNNLRLGALVDAEFSPTVNPSATGDDLSGVDDEDGVVLPSMIAGQSVSIPVAVTNATGSPAFLNAWIDFNSNSSFTDPGEQIAVDKVVASGLLNGTINLAVTVPAGATTDTNLAVRVRLTALSNPGATGSGGGVGEVEDYIVNIAAPTTDFGDFGGFVSASSTASTLLRMGARVDTEYAATTNVGATGDDITGSDDEDGVSLPLMTAGAPATIAVVLTNTSGEPGYLNAWIDFNNDGILDDLSEQIMTNELIATDTIDGTVNVAFEVPPTAETGTPVGVRFRLTSISTPGSAGKAGTGEVEDYVTTIAAPLTDFGDWIRLAVASSIATPNLRLGNLVDVEYVATRNSSASGDDNTGIDDEDGVMLPVMTAGAPTVIPVQVTNTTSSLGYLNAWIDYDNNGSMAGAGEQIATNIVVQPGTANATINLSHTVPANAVTGASVGLRFRLTSTASPGVTGEAGFGEVEDYTVSIAVPDTDFGDWAGAASASNLASSDLRMGALADTEYVETLNSDATGDDLIASDDEDGVTLPAILTPGTPASASVVLTNNTPVSGYLNAWIDFNNDGVFDGPGEQIATNILVTPGTNGAVQNVSFNVPLEAIPEQRGARFRFTDVPNPGPTGAGGTGEVEDYVVTVACLPFGINPPVMAAGTVGVAYSETLTANGVHAPFEFAVTGGSLPLGLSLDTETGVISGVLTSSAVANFTITATDGQGCVSSRNYSFSPSCSAVALSPASLADIYLPVSYSQVLTASGGNGNYAFTVLSGSLPTGLTLAPNGTISGTPTEFGSSTFTVKVVDTFGCQGTQSYTLTTKGLSVGDSVFEDSNDNGLRDTGEPGVAGALVQIFRAGSDNAVGGVGTAADVLAASDFLTDATGSYGFANLASGNYFIKVTPPPGYAKSGGTPAIVDNNIDGNNDGSQPGGLGTPLFSPVFTLAAGTEPVDDGDADADTNLSIDFGLWNSVAVGNVVFLDLNGNGVLDPNEGIEDVLVQIYPQGGTPGSTDPVGVALTDNKGRYLIDGLNPGSYFLHLPALQFAAGMPLEGLKPMSSVVAGDDNSGQDLLPSSTPGDTGASTAVFLLRPGQAPVAGAESGFEGTADDPEDNRYDLTKDLGLVSGAGSGFALGAVETNRLTPTMSSGAASATTPAPVTFVSWSQQLGVSSAEGDDDADRASNLLEYALGTDPHGSRIDTRFVLETDAATNVVSAVVIRPASGREDLRYVLEAATDLQEADWTPVAMPAATNFNADGTVTRRYVDIASSRATRGFVRLRVELDADRDGTAEATAFTTTQAWALQHFGGATRTFSMPLVKPAIYVGSAVRIDSNTLRLPEQLTFSTPHYVELQGGILIDISDSANGRIDLAKALPASASMESITIRPHHTIDELIPADLLVEGEALVAFDVDTNQFVTVDPTATLFPYQGLLVKLTDSVFTRVFVGEVRVDAASIPLAAGAQLVSVSGLTAGAVPTNDLHSSLVAEEADRLRIWNDDVSPGSTGYSSYYLESSPQGPVWTPQTGGALSSTRMDPFHAVFVIRQSPLLWRPNP